MYPPAFPPQGAGVDTSAAYTWTGAHTFNGDVILAGSVTSSTVFLAPDGSDAAPAYSFASDTDTGITYGTLLTHTVMGFVGGGGNRFKFYLGDPPGLACGDALTASFLRYGDPNVTMPAMGLATIAFSSGWNQFGNPPQTTMDAWMHGHAANGVTIGARAAATPDSCTLQVGESGTGTDIVGGNATITSGIGTGAGAASSLIFQTPTVGGSGTTAQTLATRFTVATASLTSTVPFLAPNGTGNAPSYSFSAATSLGMWREGTNLYIGGNDLTADIHFAHTSGYTLASFYYDGSGTASEGLTVRSNWSIGWSDDIGNTLTRDAGLVRSAAGIVKVTDGSTGSGKLLVADGAKGAPALGFASSTTRGIYYDSGEGAIGLCNTAQTRWTFSEARWKGIDVNDHCFIDITWSSTIGLAQRGHIGWSNTNNGTSAADTANWDTGLSRSAAGIVKVTDGSTGGGSLLLGGHTLTTTATPVLDASVTWNDAGTTHTGWKLALTDTASANGSRLIDARTADGYAGLLVEKAAAGWGLKIYTAQYGQSQLIYSETNNGGVVFTDGGLWLSSGGSVKRAQMGTDGYFSWGQNLSPSITSADTGLYRFEAGGVGLFSGTSPASGKGWLALGEATAPTGSADTAKIYAEDNGSGKTRLMVIFGSGAAQQIAIEP